MGGDAELEYGAMALNGVKVMGAHDLRPQPHGWDMVAQPWGGWSGVRGQFWAKCLLSLRGTDSSRKWANAHGQCCKPGEEGLNYHHRPRQLVILRINQLLDLLCTSAFQSIG